MSRKNHSYFSRVNFNKCLRSRVLRISFRVTARLLACVPSALFDTYSASASLLFGKSAPPLVLPMHLGTKKFPLGRVDKMADEEGILSHTAVNTRVLKNSFLQGTQVNSLGLETQKRRD